MVVIEIPTILLTLYYLFLKVVSIFIHLFIVFSLLVKCF